MKISNKTKGTFISVVSIVLVVAVVLGSVSLLSGFVRSKNVKEINPVFTLGGLNDNGEYIEQDTTIYTKDAFECNDLRIDVDFEKTIFYQIFFYAETGEFVSATDEMKTNFVSDVPDGATHARVVITPDWEALEISKNDRTIKWYEIVKYSSQLTIKTAKATEEIEETEKITDLSGTTWVINSTDITETKIIDLTDKEILSCRYYIKSVDKYFVMTVTKISFDTSGITFISEDGGEYNLGVGAVVSFATSDASTDTYLIDFMLANATLVD